MIKVHFKRAWFYFGGKIVDDRDNVIAITTVWPTIALNPDIGLPITPRNQRVIKFSLDMYIIGKYRVTLDHFLPEERDFTTIAAASTKAGETIKAILASEGYDLELDTEPEIVIAEEVV